MLQIKEHSKFNKGTRLEMLYILSFLGVSDQNE